MLPDHLAADFSQAMVDAATRRAEELGLVNVECRVLDAEQLDLPDDAVDGVLCRWGYMLMADPEAALKESRRVLRRGGHLSCAVFAAPEQNPWVALPSKVLHEHGHMPAPNAGAPGILALADRDRLRRLFAEAGFSEPHVEEVAFTWRFRDGDDYWAFLTGAAGAIAAVVDRLEEDERGRVREEIGERLQPFYIGEEIESFPLSRSLRGPRNSSSWRPAAEPDFGRAVGTIAVPRRWKCVNCVSAGRQQR
jgi:SAM-dependent methyltransferase